tara:strand:+ start:1643 stop:1870 length:228 start_codon:yes stop_codon:yes gene_type:complete
MTKKIKLPFKAVILDKEPVEVKNPYTGDAVMLTPEAVAVYDVIKGAEMFEDYKLVRKGLDWFIKNYPKEYGVLLD